MANRCNCCGCFVSSDYGTSIVVGTGSASDPYTVSRVDIAWIRPAARVRRTTSQSIPTGDTFTAITFDLEVFDQRDFWSSTDPTMFVAPQDGLYLFGGNGIWAANATGTRELALRLDGTTIIQTVDQATTGASNTPASHISYQYRLGVGQTVELMARQESGGALNLTAEADDSIVFWIVYLGKTI